MCEWHQLVYFAIITAKKPTPPPDFRCMSPLVWKQSPKCQFWGKRTTPTTSIFKPSICSKMKSLYLQQTSTFSAEYTSAILSDPVLRTSGYLVHARKEFWVIQPKPDRRTPPLSIFNFKCRTTRYYQKNIESIESFTTPNSPKLPWYL